VELVRRLHFSRTASDCRHGRLKLKAATPASLSVGGIRPVADQFARRDAGQHRSFEIWSSR
jgi:hypothetical protein